MIKPVKYKNKTLFEIETKDGIKYLKKEDKDASKKAGKPIYIMEPFDKILNSTKEIIYLK